MLRNRPFMQFILFACAFHLFFHQLYLSLPSEVEARGLGSFVPRFCDKSELGRYYGLYSCIGGIAAFGGNFGIGWLLSIESIDRQWIWVCLAIIGICAGLGLYRQVTHF